MNFSTNHFTHARKAKLISKSSFNLRDNERKEADNSWKRCLVLLAVFENKPPWCSLLSDSFEWWRQEKTIILIFHRRTESGNHLQDGFVRGRSCVTTFLRSTHDFAKALDEKNQLDAKHYSKVFDSVSFNWLLRELFAVGVRVNLLSWFRSYLTDRRQRIVIDGKSSTWQPLLSGVP